MNKSEFERMISLADEKYVDEIFEDRIYGRRKNIFISFTAAAAALAAAVVGIGYFVSTAGNNDIVVPEPVIVIDDITNSNVTDITEIAVPVDYEDFFKNKGGEFPITFCNFLDERGYNSTNVFDAEYAKSVIPFSTEGYSDSRNQFYAYCGDNNEPYGISLYLESEFDEKASPKFRGINIYICEKGKLDHTFPLEEAEPVNCFGTDIYGFDDTERYYSGVYDRNLKAYFVFGNTEYAVETCNLSCEETVNIIRNLIQSGFSITSFNMGNGHDFDYKTEEMSLAEANNIEPFAGHVPQTKNDDMYLYKTVTYAVEENDGENVWSALYFSFANDTNDKRILFNYYTREWRDTKNFYNAVINWQDITRKTLDACMVGDEYKFTLVCDGFFINVTAKCTADELWTYIENIGDDTFGTENNTITLAEALSTQFAEFLPKTEKIGDLEIGNIYLEKEKGWENPTLTLDYSSQGRTGIFSYYGIVYHMDPQRVLENVVSINNITMEYIEQLAAEPTGAGNNKNFDFSIDCGGIWINIHGDCTADEIWAFIENIGDDFLLFNTDISDFAFTPFGTLAEANKLEPFAGYVPTVKTIGDMKIYTDDGGEVMIADNEEYGRVLNIAYQSEVTTSGGVYGGYDFKAISTTYTEKKYYIDTTDPVISFDQAMFANLDDLRTDGVRQGGRVCYRFIIDCGTCYISVAADCLPDEMQNYITSLVHERIKAEEEERKRRMDEEEERRKTEALETEQETKRAEEEERKKRMDEEEEHRKTEALETDSGNTLKIIPISKLKELAKKGGDLMWSDFDGYDYSDVGSGLYIRSYGVEGGYSLIIGGSSLDEKPMYVYLDSNKKRIDIRYESIDDFLD